MADDTPDTDPELERLTWNPRVKEGLAQKLQGKKCTILIVGPAGVGKSTFINSLVLKRLCQVGTSARSVTKKIKHVLIDIMLGRDRTCSLTIIDSPGYIGIRRLDDATEKQLNELKDSFDLLLICFDLAASGSRVSPLTQLLTLKFLNGIFGEECIEQKGVIILTKGNEVKVKALPNPTKAVHQENPSTSRSQALATRPVPPLCSETEVDGESIDQLPVSVDQLLKDLKEINQEALEEGGFGKLTSLPVYVAAHVTFTKDGNPDEITEIDGTRIWYEKVWNGCALRSGDDSDVAALLLFIYQDIKEKFPGFRGPRVYMATLKMIAIILIRAGVPRSVIGAVCPTARRAFDGIQELYDYIKEKMSEASESRA